MVRRRIGARTRDARKPAMLTGSDPRDIRGIYGSYGIYVICGTDGRRA